MGDKILLWIKGISELMVHELKGNYCISYVGLGWVKFILEFAGAGPDIPRGASVKKLQSKCSLHGPT